MWGMECVMIQPCCVHVKIKHDPARAWIKEAGRMNHLKHNVP